MSNQAAGSLRGSMFARFFSRLFAPRPPARLRIVSATRLSRDEFWLRSALGRSCAGGAALPVTFDVAFDNRAGLPAVFNAAMDRMSDDEAVVFVHDDVWFADAQWSAKLLDGLRRFDIVGVAGNRRRVPRQPAWLLTHIEGGRGFVDMPNLSGAIRHGPDVARSSPSVFGPAPAACELLDGVFMAARADVLRRCGARFDERFQFHFYDLDFCRTARQLGLRLGTWPIDLVHQSTGTSFEGPWGDALQRYRQKWPD